MISKLEKRHQNLDKTLNSIIDEHKKKTGMTNEDFLDILFRLKNSGDLEFPITSEHIKAVILVNIQLSSSLI